MQRANAQETGLVLIFSPGFEQQKQRSTGLVENFLTRSLSTL
jgi:hypothetical protein